jgi:ubiquitin-conjugating enzyme E2 S
LIHPNPDSALNSSAGALLQEDYTEFARQAKLMTSIHAPVPNNLKQPVLDAKQRGEDPAMVPRLEPEQQPSTQAQETRRTGLVMKTTAAATSVEAQDENMQSDSEDLMDDYKENDPSLSPEPITSAPPFSRRNDQEKRPLSVISTAPPRDTDVVMYDSSSDDDGSSDGMTSSARNIAANVTNTTSPASSFQEYDTPPGTRQQQPQKAFAHASSVLNSSYEIYEDGQGEPAASPNRRVSRGKENLASTLFSTKSSSSLSLPTPQAASLVMKAPLQPRAPLGQFHNNPAVATRPLEPTKVTKPPLGSGVRKGSAAVKRKPRIGLRRL